MANRSKKKQIPGWLWGAILVGAVILVYQPVGSAGFIWDDQLVVTANPVIVGPLGLKEIWTTTTATAKAAATPPAK